MSDKYIPLSVPNLKGNEIKYVTDAIESEWVSTAGSYVSMFEEKIATYVHTNGAVSCQSGTAGIHLALMSCNISIGDEVLVPTLTFIAAVNPVKYVGAEPIFMDCGQDLCIDPIKIKEFCETECDFENRILRNKKTNRVVKAIIVVHIFGNMADMEAIMKIASEYNLIIIEDATEAIGTYYTSGTYKGKYAGTIGDVGVFSFNGNKIITTGGGGMIVSSQYKILEKCKHLSTQAKSDELYYTHDEIGYNYRMTNLQAAMGLAQLEQLESFIEIKKRNYLYYKNAIAKIKGLSLMGERQNIRCNYWFYALFIEDIYQDNRDQLIQKLQKRKIQTRPIWGLIHEQNPYQGSQIYNINKAIYYWKHIINIPCSTNLNFDDLDIVIEQLNVS